MTAAAFAVSLFAAHPALAQSAAAANKVAVEGGYQFQWLDTAGSSDSFPAGWFAGATGAVNSQWNWVGQIDGSNKNGGHTVSFDGGVRGKLPVMAMHTPFWEALVGGTNSGGGGSSTTGFNVTIDAGTVIPVNSMIGISVFGGYRYFRIDGVNTNGLRIGAGVNIPLGK